jgi:hypothetical protein
MPKYDLIEEEIKWFNDNRTTTGNNDADKLIKSFQDGFVAGLQHALWLMTTKSKYFESEPPVVKCK